MIKVLFLDHFGVMCLADKHGQEHSKTDSPKFNEMRVHGSFDYFDAGAVEVLNSILKTGVEVVISSDWQRWCKFDDMCAFYKSQGIIKPPIDYTGLIEGIPNFRDQRTFEINNWLRKHTEIINWVAIDDIYLPSISNFVWVSKTDEGIKQKGIKDKILSILG